MNAIIKKQGITPLLVQKAVTRTGDDNIPGHYCPQRHVWVVDDQPIVSARPILAELSTKTDTVKERDDMAVDQLLEMQTKTKVQLEKDDEDYEFGLLELMTKTSSQPERDDD